MDVFWFLVALILFIMYFRQRKKLKKLTARSKELDQSNEWLQTEVSSLKSLEKYRSIVDAEARAAEIVADGNAEAKRLLDAAREEAQESRRKAKDILGNAEERLAAAAQKYEVIIAEAELKAVEIGGKAYAALKEADQLRATITAMKNVIDGYGDQYIIPQYSLLDELAEEFGYEEAGQKLKEAREYTRVLLKEGKAAACSYVEQSRKDTAIAFVLDAFNGKVDSILSKTKLDNHGTLAQAINDAFHLVNNNGKAFRDARITEIYLNARLEELKWAVTAQALKAKQQEEQREMRERMREEARARREYERAIRDAEKQEETFRKAMEKARAELEQASDAEKDKLNAKILEIEEKLREAEEKSKRAQSMAELTRAGNVYVISNIGSFGENVYKIGLTRRLDPQDRVRELSDASVPFPFDIHAMIYSEDAPTLENELHKAFAFHQVNKVNPRKEFFGVGIQQIRELVEARGFKTTWTMLADAAEYKESQAISKQIESDPRLREEWEKHYAAAILSDDETAEEDEVASA